MYMIIYYIYMQTNIYCKRCVMFIFKIKINSLFKNVKLKEIIIVNCFQAHRCEVQVYSFYKTVAIINQNSDS